MAALGWLLNLDFSASPVGLTPVPNVVGETQAQGTTDLQNAGFVVAVATAYSSVVPAGTIISQNPVAGSTPGNGSTVTITVSLGDVPVVAASSSGGFFYDIDAYRANRTRQRRKLDELEREREESQLSSVDLEIAQLLHRQEQLDADRAERERLLAIADRYSSRGRELGLPNRVRASLIKAYEERTRNALEQLQREIDRMLEEEEAAILLLLNDE